MLHILSLSGLHFRLVHSKTATLLLGTGTAEREMLPVRDCVEEADTIQRFHCCQKDFVIPECFVFDVLVDIDPVGFIIIPRISGINSVCIA